MSTSAAAEFVDVSKEYPRGAFRRGGLRALCGVSLRLEPGTALGLVGPNRAGKTTLVKLLLGLCRPTSGRVLRLGQPADERTTLRRVGYVPESPSFPRYLSAEAVLEFYGALSLVPEEALRPRVPQLLEQVGLADRSREPISRFSKGMVQRLGVAQALVNDPQLLVFDEPAEGLDLPGRELIRTLIRARVAAGGSVLFVSHVLDEVEQVCDRVAVLSAGRLVHAGPVAELLADPATGGRRALAAALRGHYATSAEAVR